MNKSKNKLDSAGTPGKSQTEIDHPLRPPLEAVEAQAVRKLKDALNSYRSRGPKPGKDQPASKWTRSDAISLLRAIREFIASITELPSSSQNGDLEVIFEHEATSLLDGLIGALADLDRGTIDERLRTAPGHGGAALKASEKSTIALLLNTVEIVRLHKKISYAEARSKVAKSCNKKTKFRGKDVTPAMLKGWKKTRDVRRKRSK